jgi:hypothetical protein
MSTNSKAFKNDINEDVPITTGGVNVGEFNIGAKPVNTLKAKKATLKIKEESTAGVGGVGGSTEVGAQKPAPIGMKQQELSKKTNSYIARNKAQQPKNLLKCESFIEWMEHDRNYRNN